MPSSDESSESDCTPSPRDDGSASASDGDEAPEFYTPPAPASTLPPGKLPSIGRPGRPVFGCGRRTPSPSLSLAPTCAIPPLPSRRKDAALTGAAVRRRPQSPIYVDFLYLASIVGPALRRIFAVDTLQLGDQPLLRRVRRLEAIAPASDGLDCSGEHQGQLAFIALQKNLWRETQGAGAPLANSRPVCPPHSLRAMQPSSEQQRVEHGWYDQLNVDLDLEVGGVAWLLLATDPWNILLNTAGILQHTDLKDIGELKEAICVRPETPCLHSTF